MFQVCKYDLKFKNCSVPLKWVRNTLAISSCWGAWRLALVWGGGGERARVGFFSTCHLNTDSFPSARLILPDCKLLNMEQTQRAEAICFNKTRWPDLHQALAISCTQIVAFSGPPSSRDTALFVILIENKFPREKKS